MSWTTQVTYVAAAWSATETAALAKALGQAEIAYDAGGNLLRITMAVEAARLEEAAGRSLRATAIATGFVTPVRLLVQATADFVVDVEHPRPLNVDLIGITEVAGELGVSRQRAGQLADDLDFPAPVVHTAAGRL
jgi:hypothetical protein